MSQTSCCIKGLIRYCLPDLEVPAVERSLYSFPASKLVREEWQELRDFRNATEVVKGPGGLDVQGFTYVKHTSSLSTDELLTGRNVEDVYLKEVTDLICKVTGANRAVVDGVAFRQKEPTQQTTDPYFLSKRGSELDLALAKLPRDVVRIPGRDAATSTEPARVAHVDYTVNGLRNVARWGRKDIAAVAANVLEAEDSIQRGEPVKPPRYASYSVWRPLELVKRDPLAVLDWRSLDVSELVAFESRILSGITEDGESMRESSLLIPPKSPGSQRWYWMPEQDPDEALIIKFADTGAENLGIARECVHCSPMIPGNDHQAPRRSVECRVLAFWD